MHNLYMYIYIYCRSFGKIYHISVRMNKCGNQCNVHSHLDVIKVWDDDDDGEDVVARLFILVAERSYQF